jgi:hypothetical protein
MTVSGGTLKVNPPVLQSAATSFGQATEGLGSLQAAASLAEADDARQFSGNLQTAARWYERRDQAAAEAIKKIEIPE